MGMRILLGKELYSKAKFSAEKKLSFSSLQAEHMFRKCPQTRKCTEPESEGTPRILLHGADRIFPPRKEENKSSTEKLRRKNQRRFVSTTCRIVFSWLLS